MNVLVLYDKYSTFTNTVFDHLNALGRYSRHSHAYCHASGITPAVRWEQFDAVVVHYSLRVALDLLTEELAEQLARFDGIKILFVQDEYDYTDRTKSYITRLGFDIVYSCVPSANREQVYPTKIFPQVEFVETLTGYLPEAHASHHRRAPIAQRSIVLGYRGRALPYWYGDLGQEKRLIAEVMRQACENRGVTYDIEWDDSRRLYGSAWIEFLNSCKATLSTESGANLFDNDGSLRRRFEDFLSLHPDATYAEARRAVVGEAAEVPIMNQVSPRVFESITCGTALVMFDGKYSGVVQPEVHFLPLRKDFSNIDEIFGKLRDDALLQSMTDRAYDEVVKSGKYTFSAFVAAYDRRLDRREGNSAARCASISFGRAVTSGPVRAETVRQPPDWLRSLWLAAPIGLRQSVKPAAHRLWTRLHE
jgi:hypothetical protein